MTSAKVNNGFSNLEKPVPTPVKVSWIPVPRLAPANPVLDNVPDNEVAAASLKNKVEPANNKPKNIHLEIALSF